MIVALALSLALAAELPPAAVVSNLSAPEFAKTSSGEVVVKGETYKTPDGKDAGRGKAWVVINATPQECYATLTRYEDAAQYMPRLKKVTINSRSERAMQVTQDVKVVLSTYTYTMDFAFDPAKLTMSWTLNPEAKNDIKDTTGTWTFRALPDGKTLLEYGVTVDTGAAVPRMISDYLTKNDLPEVLLAFKRRVESGGKWTKG